MSAVAACAVRARTRQQMAAYGITADKLGHPGSKRPSDLLKSKAGSCRIFLIQTGARIPGSPVRFDPGRAGWRAVWQPCSGFSKLADLSGISAFYSAGVLVSEKP